MFLSLGRSLIFLGHGDCGFNFLLVVRTSNTCYMSMIVMIYLHKYIPICLRAKPKFHPTVFWLQSAASAELAAMELSPAFVAPAPVLLRSPALPTGAQRAKLGINYETSAVSFPASLRARRCTGL